MSNFAHLVTRATEAERQVVTTVEQVLFDVSPEIDAQHLREPHHACHLPEVAG